MSHNKGCYEEHTLSFMFRPSPRYPYRWPLVLSSGNVAITVHGEQFYDYYGFICRPMTPSTALLLSLGLTVTQFHLPKSLALHRVRSWTQSLPIYLQYYYRVT